MKRINPSTDIVPVQQKNTAPTGDRMVVGRVFALFASAWPRVDVSEPTLNLWASQMVDIPQDVALEAAEACVRSCEFWPSVRTFLDAVTAVKVHRARTEFIAPELPEGRDLDLAKSKVSEIRAALRNEGGDE